MILVRHGATLYNEADPPVLQGQRLDAPLSPRGWEQARRTGALLRHAAFDAIYCTPLLRTRQTAEAIAEGHKVPITVVPELVEIDGGRWEGKSWTEARQSDPEACRLFDLDPTVHPYAGGENLNQVCDRVVPAFHQLLSENVGRLIVVVAHNMVNRCYIAHLLHIPLRYYRMVMQNNCAVSLLRSRHDEIRPVTINSSWHLTFD